MNTLGDKIKNARNELKLSQSKFATLVGTTRNTISDLETGVNKGGNLDLIKSIAKITHKPLGYFLEDSNIQLGVYDIMDNIFEEMINNDLVDDEGNFDNKFNDMMLELIKKTLALKKKKD